MPLPDPASDTAVVVTGASSGIGAAIARELARRGYNLDLVARREERLERLGDELERAHDVRVHVHRADLAGARGRRRAIDSVKSGGRPVVGLVNNAGVGSLGRFLGLDAEVESKLVELNVLGVHELTAALLPAMVERGEGAILNVASIVGHGPLPTMASYAASKAFVITFSEALHAELYGTGVSCTALSPGPVRTDGLDDAGAGDVFELAPGLLLHAVDDVARAGVDGMRDGRRTVVPGITNKAFTLSARYLPRTVTLPFWALMGGDTVPSLLKRLGLS